MAQEQKDTYQGKTAAEAAYQSPLDKIKGNYDNGKALDKLDGLDALMGDVEDLLATENLAASYVQNGGQ